MRRTIRSLTDREKQILAPFLTRNAKAQRAAQLAGELLTRALQLAEPRFSDALGRFDTASLEFWEEVPNPPDPPANAIPEPPKVLAAPSD